MEGRSTFDKLGFNPCSNYPCYQTNQLRPVRSQRSPSLYRPPLFWAPTFFKKQISLRTTYLCSDSLFCHQRGLLLLQTYKFFPFQLVHHKINRTDNSQRRCGHSRRGMPGLLVQVSTQTLGRNLAASSKRKHTSCDPTISLPGSLPTGSERLYPPMTRT